MLTLLLVCSFSPRVHSIQRGPRILLRRNHSSETTKNPTKFVGFLWRRKRDSFLSFARQPWSAVFMLCKSLRAAAKNDALCRFLNALVRIPLIKYRKTKRTSKKCLSVLLGGTVACQIELLISKRHCFAVVNRKLR